MVAFWKTVKVRRGGGGGGGGGGECGGGSSGSFPKGSARPFPNPRTFASDPSCPPGVTWPELFAPKELMCVSSPTSSLDGGHGGGGGGGGGGGDEVKNTKKKIGKGNQEGGGGGGNGGSHGDDDVGDRDDDDGDDDDDAWKGREAAAVEVRAVWEDVDPVKNAKCLPSLAIGRIKSLPKYDVCFQGF